VLVDVFTRMGGSGGPLSFHREGILVNVDVVSDRQVGGGISAENTGEKRKERKTRGDA